ncbi:MAG TPA: autotransporter-associated beta strand repeat-containing protein [Pirellulales bacterium]|nr:autotransporter-associated beta strand repeat-containing protein [Pirellulales bacterium]
MWSAVVVGSLTIAPTARAAFHLWNISELYTNSSGTLQFIELSTTASGQSFVGGHSIQITFGSTHTFTIPSNLPTSPDTTNREFLIGTAGIQAAGAPAPDFIMPNGFLFSGGGSIAFFGANSGTYTALPTDGTMARLFTGGTNIVNNPQNFAGQTGKVVVADVWTGASSTSWAASGNWNGAVPGATSGTTNTDTATFSQNAANSPLVIDAGRNLQNITFDTPNVNSLIIGVSGGPSLLLTAGGTIQATSTVANAETVNAPLVLEGSYAFTSGATSTTATLNFGGGITPGPTTGTTTLALNGGNTGTNTIHGVLADHGAGLLAVSKSGAGVWILSGANTYSGGTTVTAGTLEFDTAPTLSNNSTFQINGGTLRFKATSGAASVGTGAAANVASGATLELAGSVAALASGLNRVNISNSSTSPAGVLVSGTNQVVGNIGGTGSTQVNAGSSLTANHIVQSALLIGGTATSPAIVTIAASDASGNPMIDITSNSLWDPASSASVAPESPFGADGIVSSPLENLNGGGADQAALSMRNPEGENDFGSVPEPSTLILLVIGGVALIGQRAARLAAARS